MMADPVLFAVWFGLPKGKIRPWEGGEEKKKKKTEHSRHAVCLLQSRLFFFFFFFHIFFVFIFIFIFLPFFNFIHVQPYTVALIFWFFCPCCFSSDTFLSSELSFDFSFQFPRYVWLTFFQTSHTMDVPWRIDSLPTVSPDGDEWITHLCSGCCTFVKNSFPKKMLKKK